MPIVRRVSVAHWPAPVLLGLCVSAASAQGGTLPAMAPTAQPAPASAQAPTSAAAPSSHAPRVSCSDGQLEVEANNSSLNQILRSVAHCTGLHVQGGVREQRVFGTYGPAAPATVLATLLDGTGSNMLLLEASNGQPAQLILTPRTGGPTPPSTDSYAQNSQGSQGADDDPSDPDDLPQGALTSRVGAGLRPQRPQTPYVQPQPGTQPGNQGGVKGSPGSAVTSPPSIPVGNNNVLGSPANQSPTASTYPTTNSVPLDSVATPSTTQPVGSGIVDAPNPPAAGSDTAAALNGSPRGTPGSSTISPGSGAQSPSTELTPEQVFQQLQQRLQQQQQQQQQQAQPEQPESQGNGNPQ